MELGYQNDTLDEGIGGLMSTRLTHADIHALAVCFGFTRGDTVQVDEFAAFIHQQQAKHEARQRGSLRTRGMVFGSGRV